MNSPLKEKTRTTKETHINIQLRHAAGTVEIETPVPFFTHMLTAMLFHGSFSGSIRAQGDVEVDPHHLVEDVGIVLGGLLFEIAYENQPITRFGHALIPMDDALGECVVDFSRRSFLHYDVFFPQTRVGNFDFSLGREFFIALSRNAFLTLHLIARYGVNSHHMMEALFKACGKALCVALNPLPPEAPLPSTKGAL